MAEGGGLNLYAAFGNSPVNAGDAYGLKPLWPGGPDPFPKIQPKSVSGGSGTPRGGGGSGGGGSGVVSCPARNYSGMEGVSNSGEDLIKQSGFGLLQLGFAMLWRLGGSEPTPIARVANSGEAEVTSLYRAASAEEVVDITQNGFRAGRNSMSNKWFAESPKDASVWAKRFFKIDQKPVFTVRLDIPTSVAEQMMYNPRLDGVGPARSADSAMLSTLNEMGIITVLKGNILP